MSKSGIDPFLKTVKIIFSVMMILSFGHGFNLEAGEKRKSVHVQRVLIRLIENIEVPAQETGVLTKVKVHEGDSVTKGQNLGTIYDDSVKIDLEKAKLQLRIAREKSKSDLAVKLAENEYENKKQLEKEHAHELKMAQMEAENMLNVKSIEKAQKVAANNYERAVKARKEFADSVSESEIEKRKLTLDKATIDYDQARFENKINQIKAILKSEEGVRRTLSVEHSAKEVENAKLEQEVQLLETDLRKLEVDEVILKLDRLNMKSPIDGVVVKSYRQEGEWVEAGEPLFRIIKMSQLRAEGFVSIDEIPDGLENSPVTIRIHRDSDTGVERKGKIVFVSPEVDPDNREVLVWAVFENPDKKILPGMHGAMKIHVD